MPPYTIFMIPSRRSIATESYVCYKMSALSGEIKNFE